MRIKHCQQKVTVTKGSIMKGNHERQFKAQVPTLEDSNQRQCSAGSHATEQAVRHGVGSRRQREMSGNGVGF